MTLDVHDLELTKNFWQAVLAVEIEYESATWVAFASQHECSGLCLQLVPEEKVVKNRAHLDIVLDDYEKDILRLKELGATALEEVTINIRRWTIMTDPEGNEFCAIRRDRQ